MGASTCGDYDIVLLSPSASDPVVVDCFEILINADTAGPGIPGALHQPDNIDTSANSLMIQEDPGSHNSYPLPEGTGKTTARIWRYDLKNGGPPEVVVRVDQSSDPTGRALGAWESSGIVDASDAFGKDMFLVDVQAHGWEIDTASSPTRSRENGQLLLVKIQGA